MLIVNLYDLTFLVNESINIDCYSIMDKSKYPVLVPVKSEYPTVEFSKIAIIGDAPGGDEVIAGRPFVGRVGEILNDWLKHCQVSRESCFIGNIFLYKADDNNERSLFMNKIEYARLRKENAIDECPYPIHSDFGYIRPAYWDGLAALHRQLVELNPNIIVTLGPTALWGLTGLGKISTFRGTVLEHKLKDPNSSVYKILPTYHPSAVMRNWSLYGTAAADMYKAAFERASPTVTRYNREIWIEPTLDDIETFFAKYIRPLKGSKTPIAVDIETDYLKTRTLTVVGFAPSPSRALVIPFMRSESLNKSYWPTVEAEARAWAYVEEVVSDPGYVKLGQNFTYDMSWFLFKQGIAVRGPLHDTMHAHHALQPEMPKKLGFLASLYTNETAWKSMVDHKGNKKDE